MAEFEKHDIVEGPDDEQGCVEGLQRAQLAFINTIARRKGVPPIEEDLVEDVPGWSLRRFLATAKRAHKDEHNSIGL
jgi:hypothetical protein